MGKGSHMMTALGHVCFQPFVIPVCLSGASSPARPATPLVPCSSTTPPPPPPRPPSRPKLPPGKPGVGDVVCSLLPWLAQRLRVRMTNRSQNTLTQAISTAARSLVQMALTDGVWKAATVGWVYISTLPKSLPSFTSRSKTVGIGSWGCQFCYSGFDAN